MRYARHIGRVGALAVTLGVGWAVASATGVAHADTSEGSAPSRSPGTSSSSPSSPGPSKTSKKADDKSDDDTRSGKKSKAEPKSEDEDEGPTKVKVKVASDEPSEMDAPDTDPAPSPLSGSTVLASLAAARDELERNTIRRTAAVAPQVEAADDDTPNVLVIGVDGTNLRRVLADPSNENFFGLIQNGTTAPSTIVGHTTISNPSWSSILTGNWGETTGVINNVFTPWTYEKWPTVFTQLETADPDIETTAIANWPIVSAISASGEGADTVIDIAHIDGDTNWVLTDNAVGDATEAVIAAASADNANFVFSYFVGVDENGHLYGGDSPEYAAAIRNFDSNLGEILDAVEVWEAETGEQWTIIMVTDHGHQPQQGVGHGFQSPDETSTFVIAENPDLFDKGAINLKYSIIDVTPTVMTLFGHEPAPDAEGVPITDLDDSTVTPADNDEALRAALLDAIAMYGYPDIGTNLALSARTVFASIPYFIYTFTTDTVAELKAVAEDGSFPVSTLAALAIVPVQLVGDVAYIATNVVAQIVAQLTGVTGASIFPLWPPAPPTSPQSPEDASVPSLRAVACSGGRVSSALFTCGDPAIAV